MKIRMDFVTNSSSSSFIIAKADEFTNEQEQIILDYVKNKMFGKKIATTKEELDAYYLENFDEDTNDEDFKDSYRYPNYLDCLNALEKGLSIYSSWISFDECEYSYCSMFQDLWEELENHNNQSFIGIDTSMDY